MNLVPGTTGRNQPSGFGVKWTLAWRRLHSGGLSFSVEFDHAIHSLRRHKNAAIIETGVPVTFAHSIG